MKTSLLKAVLLGGLTAISLAPSALADDSPWGPFTAGATLTSDYRFRGISNSDRGAAVQGWVQYDHASGFWANVWASNVDFNDGTPFGADETSAEIDLTAGYNFSLGPNTGATAKVVYYWYPDSDFDYDYWELIGSINHSFGKIGVSGEVAYSPDFYNETGDAWALTGGATVPLFDSFLFFTDGLEASVHVGHQWVDESADYLFYDFGATASWGQVAFDVRWVDTDLSHAECALTDWCEGGVVLSISAELP